jgi:hypothetical protein
MAPVGSRFLRSTRRRGGCARPSIAATPRSRQLSEQVPPRRLQEFVALADPELPPAVQTNSFPLDVRRLASGCLWFRVGFCHVAHAINEKPRRRTDSSVPQGHNSDGSGSNRQLDRQDLDRGSQGAEPQHRLRQGR